MLKEPIGIVELNTIIIAIKLKLKLNNFINKIKEISNGRAS
jgi:hypothetical protein